MDMGGGSLADAGPSDAGQPGADAGDATTAPATPAPDSSDAEEARNVEALAGQADAEPEPAPPPTKIKLGEKEYTPEEAAQELEAVTNRMKGADRTTAAYRQRAEEAIRVAEQMKQQLIQAGIYSEDGNFVVKTPEQIRAEAQGQPAFEFKMPSALDTGDQKATDAFFSNLEEVAQSKGFKYAMALFADHMDQVLRSYHEQAQGLLDHRLNESLSPMRPFFDSLHETQARGDFLYDRAQLANDAGHLYYPELQDANAIAPLNRILDEFAQMGVDVHTPQAFDTAVKLYRANPPRAAQPASVPAQSPRPAMPQPPPTVNEAAPSGVPRPAPSNGVIADAARRLLKQPGRMGGIHFS